MTNAENADFRLELQFDNHHTIYFNYSRGCAATLEDPAEDPEIEIVAVVSTDDEGKEVEEKLDFEELVWGNQSNWIQQHEEYEETEF